MSGGLNRTAPAERQPFVHNVGTGFHTFMNTRGRQILPSRFDPTQYGMEELKAQPKALVNRMRLALLVHGVDVGSRIGGFLSATHTQEDVETTAEAFRQAIRMLRQESELPA